MPRLIPSLVTPLINSPTTTNTSPPTVWGRAPLFDFEKGEFLFNGAGQMVIGDDLQSAIQLVRLALITARNRWYRAFPPTFGSDIPAILGKSYSDAVKASLCERFTREAIQGYSFIRLIKDVSTAVQGDLAIVTLTVVLINGQEVNLQNDWTIR